MLVIDSNVVSNFKKNVVIHVTKNKNGIAKTLTNFFTCSVIVFLLLCRPIMFSFYKKQLYQNHPSQTTLKFLIIGKNVPA